MSGELQPLDTEGHIDELSRIIGELGGIATRGSGLGTEVKELTLEARVLGEVDEQMLGTEVKKLILKAKVILEILWCATCPDCEEALSDEDAASEQAMQDRAEDCAEEIEFLPENREY